MSSFGRVDAMSTLSILMTFFLAAATFLEEFLLT